MSKTRAVAATAADMPPPGAKLSADQTGRKKILFPAIYFASLIPITLTYLRHSDGKPILPGLLLLLGMALFGIFAMKQFLWDLADDVYDQGDALLVTRRGVSESVALSNVRDVTYANMRPPRLTLHLRTPGRFGARVSFSPAAKRSRNPFAKHPLMEQLAVRAWRARTADAQTHDGGGGSGENSRGG